MGYGLFNHLQQQKKTSDGLTEKLSVLQGQLAGKLKHYDAVVAFFGAYPYAMQRHFYMKRISRFLLAGQYYQQIKNRDWQQLMTLHHFPEKLAGLNSLEASQMFFLQADFPAYLLNYLGDRQEMSVGLEGRVPFLDHTLAEFICTLPLHLKLRGNTGKFILREAMAGLLADPVRNRPKKVFYAPAFESLDYFGDPDYFRAFTSLSKFEEVGVFNPWFFQLLTKAIRLLPPGNRFLPVAESVAVFILSLHIVHDFFIRDYDGWQKHFAPPSTGVQWSEHNAAQWYKR